MQARTKYKNYKQPAAYSFHLSPRQECAIRFLLNGRTHPVPEQPPKTITAFSIRLGGVRETALSKLARWKGLSREAAGGRYIAHDRSGWMFLIRAAVDAYLDREVPDWGTFSTDRAGGSRSGWAPIVREALDQFFDKEFPGWRNL